MFGKREKSQKHSTSSWARDFHPNLIISMSLRVLGTSSNHGSRNTRLLSTWYSKVDNTTNQKPKSSLKLGLNAELRVDTFFQY